MVCPATTARGCFSLAWTGVWARDPAGPRRRKTKGSIASLVTLGRIFVHEPPRENLRHYAIFQGTNRAADPTKAGLWVWPAGTIDGRPATPTPSPKRGKVC